MKMKIFALIGLNLVLAGALQVAWGACAEDPWRDVKYAWTFDRDFNGDGVLQVNEVRDVRYWGSTNANGAAAGTLVPASIGTDGNDQAPALRSGSVFWPARGVTITNTSWAHFACVTNWHEDADPSKSCWWGKTSGISFPSGNSTTGSCSVVARVRAESFGHHSSGYSFLINNGESWGSYAGMNIGFQAGNSKDPTTNGYVYVMIGQKSARMTNYRLLTNVWYDVGYSIKDLGGGKAQVTFMLAGESLNGVHRHRTFRTQTVTIGEQCFTNEKNHGSQLCLGAETIGDWHENSMKCFVGDVHRVALWTRALEPVELAEAMGQPATHFQIGMEDDRNGEFGLMDEVETEEAYVVDGQPWHDMPRELSATAPTLRISYTPRTAEARQDGCMFRLKTTSASEGASTLALRLGTFNLGTRPLAAGGVAEWFVKGGLLAAGANTFTLTRQSGSGTVCAIDAVQLTGSWMLGTDNGDNGEFTVENKADPTGYLMTWDFASLMRCIVGLDRSGNGTHSLWFKVPDSLAQHYEFRFTGRTHSNGASNFLVLTNSVANGGMGWKYKKWPFAVALNGVDLYKSEGLGENKLYSFSIPRGTLSNGWNVIQTHFTTNAPVFYWICFDFHRLEMLPNPNGTIFLLR